MKKGSIEKRGDNKFRLSYTYHYKKHRKTIEAINKREAEKYLKAWIEEIENSYTHKKYYTVKAFSKLWLENQVLPNSTWDRTVNKYQSFFNMWFYPKFGDKLITEITTEDMLEYFNWLRIQKTQYSNRTENKTLSFESVLKYKSIVHSMFETAVEWNKIKENPCNIKLVDKSNYDTRVDYYRYMNI